MTPTVPSRGGSTRVVAGTCLAVLVGLVAALGCTQQPTDEANASIPVTDTRSTKPGSVRYVSTEGRDDWPGTKKRPWRTLARAFRAVYAGQTLYVRGGVYRERLEHLNLHRGRVDKPIVVKNFPNENPVLRGAISLRRPMHWLVQGLDVTADPALRPRPQAVLRVTGGVGWTWTRSEIWGSTGFTNVLVAGLDNQEPASWSLTRNCIHDVAPPPRSTRTSNVALGDMTAAGPGLIARNLIFGDRAQYQLAIGSAAGGPTDVVIRYNTVYGGGVSASLVGDTRGVRLERNILAEVRSDVLVRWNSPRGSGNTLEQNLGVHGNRFYRPAAEAVIGGPGNVLTSELAFGSISRCDGFHPQDAVALPYGRYGVG